MAQIRSKPFGVTKEGANVTEYILSNPGGMSVSVLDYGCVIKNIIVPAKNGPVDVVLGHDTMADYENDFTSSGSTCCGAFVGRYANRIENAVFTLGGKTYQLEKNNGENHLHGCFSRKIYEVKYFGDTLLMEAVSPDGEDGFPGTLKIAVRYTLTEDNTFRMDYRVSSDADTIVNLTNHSDFNLDGGGAIWKATTPPAPPATSCPWQTPPWTLPPVRPSARRSTPASPRPPWWAAATTTAMSSTAHAVPARASAHGLPVIRPASA